MVPWGRTHAIAKSVAFPSAFGRPGRAAKRLGTRSGDPTPVPEDLRPVEDEPLEVNQNTKPRFLAQFSIAFAVVFGLTWAYVASVPMAFLSRDYPLWVAKRTMLDACRLGAVAVFGDSRTVAATVPGVMPVPVVNFAMSGTSPIETYFAVERALRCPTPPKLVVIAHGALKFGGDSDYWTFTARTGFLTYAQMRAVDADAARLGDGELDALRPGDQLPGALREFLFAVGFPPFYFDSLVNGYVGARWWYNRGVVRDSLASSGHALFGTAGGSGDVAVEGHAPGFEASPLVDLYFSRTLDLLSRRGIPVVMMTMPINHATFSRTSSQVKDGFARYLQAKAEHYPSLRVVGPTIPCWPDRFFGDAWHFNAEGAEAYSRLLGPWLADVLAGRDRGDLPDRCPAAG